jgi:hypothetical protein
MARKLSVFSSLMWNYSFHNNFCQKIIIYLESLYNKLYLFWYKVYFEILKDEFKILTGRTFSRNKMARKLSVFSSLMWNYSFNNNFCQKIIKYLESLYNKLYFDIKFISKYWKMNSKSWQNGLFHATKWREIYQCSRLWCEIILFIIISVKW